MSTSIESQALRSGGIPTWLLVAFALFAIVAWSYLREDYVPAGTSAPPAPTQVEEAKVSIARFAGIYYNEDGLRAITIKEVLAEDGWNGQLIFTPGVGDWAKPLRCRMSGSTVLAVEIPASSGRVVVAMFGLRDPRTIVGEIKPWDGIYRR